MAYTTLASVKIYLGISTATTGDDTLLESLITRSQKQIESRCRRVFDATSSGNTYYYQEDSIITLPIGSQYQPPGTNHLGYGRYSWDAWGNSYGSGQYGNTVLYLDRDLLSVTSLANGDSTSSAISSTSYFLEPRNSTTAYQYVRLKNDAAWQFATDGEIGITGIWAFSTTAPADIVQATERLVAYHYRRRDVTEYDVTAVSEAGVITVTPGMPSDVVAILEEGGYVRRKFVR